MENKRLSFLSDAGLNLDGNELDSFSALENALSGANLTDAEIEALEALRKLRIQLAEHINEVDHHNQLNMTLVGQALEFHEFSLRLLLNAAGGDAMGYTREGPSHTGKDTRIFDGTA